jgi:aldose 1-epimerase
MVAERRSGRRWLPRTSDDLLIGLDRKDRPHGLRAFFATTITMSIVVFRIAFEIGAYHAVFYWRLMDIFVISSVLLLGAFVNRGTIRVGLWMIVILCIPVVWLVARFLQPFGPDSQAEHVADLVLIGLSVACLPLTLLAAARIIAPDYFTLPEQRLKVAAIVIVAAMGIAGFLVGQFNYRFTTCQDYVTAGDNQPSNCHKPPSSLGFAPPAEENRPRLTSMAASVAPSGHQWTIASGDHQAVIVEVGGGVRAYRYQGRDYLDGYTDREMAPFAAGQVLVPWPNRIRDGRYTAHGLQQSLPLTEPDLHNASHGLARWLLWQLDEATSGGVRLSCRIPAQPGYPWTLQLGTRWAVDAEGLSATHTATNLSDTPAPFGAGAHPYVRLPDTAVEDVVLTVPARSRLAVDDRLLPTESVPVAGTPFDYTTARPIGDAVLDTTFGDLIDGDGVELAGPHGGPGVQVWADDAYAYWQVFTADSLPGERHRRAVAVEPMTCPPDAFRSGVGVTMLDPGETWRGSWGITPFEGRPNGDTERA